MSIPIIKTKLLIPTIRPNLVSRSRLLEKLNQGLNCKLTLISAPAGFGKTTLAAEWVRQLSVPVSWLTLDEGDNNLPLFLNYFTTALISINDRLTLSINPAMIEHGKSILVNQMAEIINSMVDNLSETFKDNRINRQPETPCDCVFVLDDYHHIHAMPVHESINFLIEYLPPRFHLVILSRSDPPLPLAKLRVKNQINELRVSELRFSPEEAALFFRQVMGLQLSNQDVSILETKTEGWVAGLQMAGISMQGKEDIRLFFENFAGNNRYIFDYLTDEVLKKYPEDVRSFLLHTSILDDLTVDLCNVVTQRKDSKQILTLLEKENLFITALDDNRETFRYHALFADLLRYTFNMEYPDMVNDLHRRASNWYFQNGLIFEGLKHLIHIGDMDMAAKYIEESDMTFTLGGEIKLLTHWLDILPQKTMRSRPRLSIYYAWAHLLGFNREGMQIRIDDALDGLNIPRDFYNSWPASTDQELQEMLEEIASLQCFLATYQAEFPKAFHINQKAVQHFSAPKPLLEGSLLESRGDYYRDVGDIKMAYQTYLDARKVFDKAGIEVGAVVEQENIAAMNVLQGELTLADAQFKQVIQWGESSSKPFFSVSKSYMGLGRIFLLRNDLENAENYLRRGLSQGELGGYQLLVIKGTIEMIQLKLALGQTVSAINLSQQICAIAQKTGFKVIQAYADATLARTWAHPLVNQMNLAHQWAATKSLEMPDQIALHQEYELLTLVRILIVEKTKITASEYQQIVSILTSLLEDARIRGRKISLIECLILRSIVREQMDDVDAFTDLKLAVQLAEKERILRIFLDYANHLEKLVSHLHNTGEVSIFVDSLVQAIHNQSQLHSMPFEYPGNDSITAREREVLLLLADGYHNKEIAERLSTATGTVKKHLENIYLKLGVNSRTQAVKRARDLGVI